MKLLVAHPGASTSTCDVADGLCFGLQHHGVDLVRYRLDHRINRSHSWLHYNWRKTKKTNADVQKPTTADVFYQAGVGMIEMALRHAVDAVVVVSAMFVHPDVLIMMRRAHLRVVVLFTESPYDLAEELTVAKLVDGCWTSERSCVETFARVNPKAGYIPHGWHPERHLAGPQPGDAVVASHDVVFVGTAFDERIEWLSAIDWTGIDFGLYGNWERLGSRHPLRKHLREAQISNQQTAALYRNAKVGLNLYRTSKGWSQGARQITHAESLNPRA